MWTKDQFNYCPLTSIASNVPQTTSEFVIKVNHVAYFFAVQVSVDVTYWIVNYSK